MEILHLTLKKKWFGMIFLREKPEEYRDIKPYWTKRFQKKNYTHIEFTNGYGKKRPSFVIELKALTTGIGNPEWGAPAHEVYILKLGEIT